MAVAVVRAIEPHAQCHHVYFKRLGGGSTSVGHSSGDLLAHFYSCIRSAPLGPRNIAKAKLADRVRGVGYGVGDAGNSTDLGIDVSPPGRLLRGGDGLPRRNRARSPARAASDRILFMDVRWRRVGGSVQRANRAVDLQQRGRVSLDLDTGLPAGNPH